MRLCVVVLLISCAVSGRRGGSGHTSHSYPHSTGMSGTGSGPRYNYPPSTGLSGNTRYNSNNYNYQQNTARHTYNTKTEVHQHYHYAPPQQINYGSSYHPVYHGTPPVYIYEYRNSGSRFDNLLTGLALYNLGRMSANNHYHNYGSNSYREYSGTPGEVCKLGISKRTGEYEETRIDCKLMSSFIYDSNTSFNERKSVLSNTVSTTITNVTQSSTGSGNNSSVTTVTVKNESVTDALKVKGPSIDITPGMTCYMIRISRDRSVLKKNVECGLLQEYARLSLRGSSEQLKPAVAILLNVIVYCFLFVL